MFFQLRETSKKNNLILLVVYYQPFVHSSIKDQQLGTIHNQCNFIPRTLNICFLKIGRIMLSFYTLLIVCCILWVSSNGQKFNAFKSYKDAKIKPKHYGRTEQRSHPIEEYLSDNQIKMLRSRRGAIQFGSLSTRSISW